MSIDIKLFKAQIKYLKQKGYYACNWGELKDHIDGKKKLPHKTVMFHFDDGFLDNWSVVFPIMKEAGFKYSIVITPEFIQDGDKTRPFVSQTNRNNLYDWWGYLNREEVKVMSESGLVDFQAHGYTHTWYEISDELVDVYTPNTFYPHLIWNNNVARKSYWLTENLGQKEGYPVFSYKKSLEMDRRFFPSQELLNKLLEQYDSSLNREDNLANYQRIIRGFDIKSRGRYESDLEKSERLKRELYDARMKLEEYTGKPVEYLVFPGGGNSKEVVQLCSEFGYKLISKGEGDNTFGTKVFQINRFSAVYVFPLMNHFLNMLFLRFQLARGRGNKLVKMLFKILK